MSVTLTSCLSDTVAVLKSFSKAEGNKAAADEALCLCLFLWICLLAASLLFSSFSSHSTCISETDILDLGPTGLCAVGISNKRIVHQTPGM